MLTASAHRLGKATHLGQEATLPPPHKPGSLMFCDDGCRLSFMDDARHGLNVGMKFVRLLAERAPRVAPAYHRHCIYCERYVPSHAEEREPQGTDATTQWGFYVSQYTVDRRCGGPQEGGWWYDWHDFDRVRRHCASMEEAIKLALAYEAAYDRLGWNHPDRFQSIGTPDTVFIAEERPGQYQDTHRPHYE